MALGLFAPLPMRLGGSREEGWASTQHARLAADLVAAKRGAALAIITYTKAGGVVTIHDYYGQNGVGLAYAPDSVVVVGTGEVTFKWTARSFQDVYQVSYPINIRGGKAAGHGSASRRCPITVVPNGFTVKSLDASGTAIDAKVTAALF